MKTRALRSKKVTIFHSRKKKKKKKKSLNNGKSYIESKIGLGIKNRDLWRKNRTLWMKNLTLNENNALAN